MTPPGDDPAPQVSTLELFFDLVFVFTVTQVAHLVSGHGPSGLLRAALALLITWWMYGGYVWLTNNVGTLGVRVRLLLLCGMAGFLIMALATPGAFGTDGLVFALAYLLVIGVHAALFLSAPNSSARAILGVLPINLTAVACLLLAALLPEGWRLPLWLLAGLTVLSNALWRRERGFQLNARHFAERHGAVILIALGESIVSVGVGVGGQAVGPGVVLTAVLGLALAAALWWSYFDSDDEQAGLALSRLSAERRARLALIAYGYAYFVMLGGIVLVAAGVGGVSTALHGGEGHGGEAHSGLGAAPWWLALGLSVYLLGDALFRRLLGLRHAAVRLVTALLTPLSLPLGLGDTLAGGLWQMAALTLLLVLMLLAEAALRRASPPPATVEP